jgi:alginate O-acetyltransferase complex protein AlgI
MLFNSYEFILVFLPIVLVVFHLVAKSGSFRIATAVLVMASLTFYAYWDFRYLPLLVGSILVNFTIGRRIERTLSKHLLVLGICFNLGLLAYFKYTCFFLASCNVVLGSAFFVPNILMPIGISFFSFTQLAYIVDAYRGETKGYDLLSYSLFVTYFPHLIAGPILYHKHMIPQFQARSHFTYSDEAIAAGVATFSIGLFKKVFIADSLSTWVKPVFDHVDLVTFLDGWAGALAYSFQLYFDFSGYSDMAIGLGLMLNVRLPINFDSPYNATSIIDFWKRWHITLSVFLKNYLYIPLGGNRHGEGRRTVNLMVTMLLGGLWHGAGWTFVIWGGMHGLYLVINHAWRKHKMKMPDFAARALTFLAVVVAWVFFRARTFSDAVELLKAMCGFKGILWREQIIAHLHGLPPFEGDLKKLLDVSEPEVFLILGLLYFFVAYFRNTQKIVELLRPKWWMAIAVGLIGAVSILRLNRSTEFLYFQF